MKSKAQPQAGKLVVVIDTTLLSRLCDLEIIHLLPMVFKQVRIPTEVKNETRKAPGRRWKRLRRQLREMGGFFVDCREHDPIVREIIRADLDLGEADAIAQADHTGAGLLMDENKGVRYARNMNLTVIRTGRILCWLKETGDIPLVEPYLLKLRRMGFHLSEGDFEMVLSEAGELRRD